MDKEKWGVHERHCCVLHGCKYDDEDCPVENNRTKQDYACEWCCDDGFRTVEEVEELIYWKNKAKEHRGKDFMSVSVSFLNKLINK
jgi:hypothetical protein